MLLVARITLLVLIATTVKGVHGIQRIVSVSELSNGEDNFSCCVNENCTCNSFAIALARIASNVLINVTSNVTLSSIIKVSHLENLTIIGFNNPTANCKNVGGLQFISCRNIKIWDITWDGCGKEIIGYIEEPAIKLMLSHNIIIQSCSFQHSIGQAIVLSDISGDVNIIHCQFVNNTHFRNSGAAIYHYSSRQATDHPQLLLAISYCNFSYNSNAQSLIYLRNKTSAHNNSITISHSKFCHNEGSPIYMENHKLYLNGILLFLNNTAEQGAGIRITSHSTLMFGKLLIVK